MSDGEIAATALAVYLVPWGAIVLGSYVDWRRGRWSKDDWWIAVPLGALWPLLIPMLASYSLHARLTRGTWDPDG